jgi:nitrate reductase NapD
MPVGGFVVAVALEERENVVEFLKNLGGSTVYGYDEDGNIVMVLDMESSEEMEKTVEEVKKTPGVLHVGLAYMHYEDELEKIEKGIIKPEIRFGRKPPK